MVRNAISSIYYCKSITSKKKWLNKDKRVIKR